MEFRIALYIVVLVIFSSCAGAPSYQITRLESQIDCSCQEVRKSIKKIRKQYKAKKAIKIFEDIYVPIDVVREEKFIYHPFKVILDCTKHQFKPSEDEQFFIISPKQWETIRKKKCAE